MERLDAIVAGLGVLVVIVAIGGVVATGPGAGAPFRVVFVEAGTPLEAQTAAFPGDGSTEVAVDVDVANLTRLQFTVRVAAAGPRPAADTIEVTLVGPDGVSETQTGQLAAGGAADVSLTFDRPVRALPPEQSVRAANAGAAVAAAQAPPAEGNATGMGPWTITVAASGGALPQLHVENHNVVVETTAFAFRAQVPPANPG